MSEDGIKIMQDTAFYSMIIASIVSFFLGGGMEAYAIAGVALLMRINFKLG